MLYTLNFIKGTSSSDLGEINCSASLLLKNLIPCNQTFILCTEKWTDI